MSGTKVNLTVHESSEAGDKVMDVRLRLEDAVINIRYMEIIAQTDTKPFNNPRPQRTTVYLSLEGFMK